MIDDDGQMNGATPHQPAPDDEPFWQKPLGSLSDQEWEALCDGCGRCCLVKLEDEDTGAIHFTSVGCTLLDAATCRCRDYPNRQSHVPDCVRLTRDNVSTLPWLPKTCAYRLRANGQELPHWHPLVSGDRTSVITAGISVQGRTGGCEDDIPIDDLPDYIVRWPNRWPSTRRRKAR